MTGYEHMAAWCGGNVNSPNAKTYCDVLPHLGLVGGKKQDHLPMALRLTRGRWLTILINWGKTMKFSIYISLLLLLAPSGANAAGAMLRVVCDGDDVGAAVSVNGKFKGECPVDVSVNEGAYKLRVEKKDALYEWVYEQDIRMGDGVVKKVEAVLSKRLHAEGQRRENERLAAEQAEAERRAANKARKRAMLLSRLEENMVAIPSKTYALGKFEVTQGEWQAVMGNNPSNFTGCGENCPVEQVTLEDVETFLSKLNQLTGKEYRLPTIEEWEYACYGGAGGLFSSPDYCGGNDINTVAWYSENSGGTTHPVGQKVANGYGLYDMSGNVWEWMSDTYTPYPGENAIQGGCFKNDPDGVQEHYSIRRSFMNANEPSFKGAGTGFRLAMTLFAGKYTGTVSSQITLSFEINGAGHIAGSLVDISDPDHPHNMPLEGDVKPNGEVSILVRASEYAEASPNNLVGTIDPAGVITGITEKGRTWKGRKQ